MHSRPAAAAPAPAPTRLPNIPTTAAPEPAVDEDPMTTTTTTSEHLNSRPTWERRLCNQPWPCAGAKASLLAEFQAFPSVLTIYLSSQMYDALIDMTANGEPTPLNLYERFLSWTRRP
jgi:hypothetical protein